MTKQDQATIETPVPQVSDFPVAVRALIDGIKLDDALTEVAHMDTDEIAKGCAEFVYKGVFMGLCSSIDSFIASGEVQIDRAGRQLARAIASDTGTNRSDRTQDTLEKRTKWLAQMVAQQDLRRHLKAEMYDLYQLATGERYIPSRGNSLEQVTADQCKTADQSAAASLLKRVAS